MKLAKSLSIFIATLLLTACGASIFAGLRLAVASSGPLVNQLVVRKLITQAQADNFKGDFSDLVNVTEQADKDFRAATTKGEKLLAVQKAADAWGAILARGHFVSVPYLNDALQIIDAIFETLVAFYGGGSSKTVGAPRLANEGELKAYLKAQSEKLKQSLQVK